MLIFGMKSKITNALLSWSLLSWSFLTVRSYNRQISVSLSCWDPKNVWTRTRTTCDANASRRIVLQQGVFGMHMPLVVPSWEELPPMPPTPLESECRDGAIVAESAVPGAYQQICMTLAERAITLKSTGDQISVLQGSSVGAGRTGVAVWNSCVLLTRLLDSLSSRNKSWLRGKTVMELGCGTGLASIAACKFGAARVLATDGNPNVIDLARQNAKKNQVEDEMECQVLQWGFMGAVDYGETIDLVIGSDLTYNSGMWRALAETISTVLSPGGVCLYLTLGHSGLNVQGELHGFLSVVQSQGGLEILSNGETETAAPPLEPVLHNVAATLETTISPNEQSVLSSTGGVQVILLGKSK